MSLYCEESIKEQIALNIKIVEMSWNLATITRGRNLYQQGARIGGGGAEKEGCCS
eukprot:SAG31_NODE_2769_length_5117_cov_1.964727_6_plen_55_part_00